jgi:hypothetical protein
MAWDFSTDPEYQRKLDWARDFVRTQKDRPLAGVRVVLTHKLCRLAYHIHCDTAGVLVTVRGEVE